MTSQKNITKEFIQSIALYINLIEKRMTLKNLLFTTGNLKVSKIDIQVFEYRKEMCNEIQSISPKTSVRLKKTKTATG